MMIHLLSHVVAQAGALLERRNSAGRNLRSTIPHPPTGKETDYIVLPPAWSPAEPVPAHLSRGAIQRASVDVIGGG